MQMYGNYGRDRGEQFGKRPPVNEGEELDVHIEAVGEKGDGVAKKDGFVLFVPNVKEGDEVRIRVTKVLRKVGFAEVIGQAQGPVAAAAPKRQPSAAETRVKEMENVAAQAEQIEDSEDFGDEPTDEPDEEPAEEEPEEDDFGPDEPDEEPSPKNQVAPPEEPIDEEPEELAEPFVQKEDFEPSPTDEEPEEDEKKNPEI